ncbi:MAG: hypothetical protein P4L53_22205 [Candidatus Obscuribacterales bacterium]|nr:hypothetical protein [Candidatus Obscuribacterales bacterium]
MFEGAAQKIEKGLEQITHVDFEHASAGDKLRLGAVLAFGGAAFVVAKRFHVPEEVVAEAVTKVAEVATTGTDLSVAELLAHMPKPEVSNMLSPHFQHAESLAQRLAAALKQDGEITANLERALNEHSAEHFPYVKPLTVEAVAEDDDRIARVNNHTLFVHGDLVRNANGEVELSSPVEELEGEGALAAVLGHEYNHVEQQDFLDFVNGNPRTTEGQVQRATRIVDSFGKNDEIVLRALQTENEVYPLRAVHFAGKKSMVEANAISPANFAPYYQKLVSLPADEIPNSFKVFMDRQNALRPSLFPVPTDHDMGRQFFIVLRGQIQSVTSRAVMARAQYRDLYHETEALQLEKAINSLYPKVSGQAEQF